MLRQSLFRHTCSRRVFHHFATSNASHSTLRRSLVIPAASGIILTSALLWYTGTKPVHNDAQQVDQEKVSSRSWNLPQSEDCLSPVVCGSNQSHVLSPEQGTEPIRTPAFTSYFGSKAALRHLALHESHGACADARGNVYQWGDGFDHQASGPQLTLRGKDIVHLEVTEDRVFALSSSGAIYTLPSRISDRSNWPAPPPPCSWWNISWLWRESPTVGSTRLSANVSLTMREKFVSISAGTDHLLALTSNGRVFSYPFNLKSNACGQLGHRKFDIPDATSGNTGERVPIELIPKSIKDPFAKASPYSRKNSDSSSATDTSILLQQGLFANDRLFEVPTLRGVKIAQIATGSRSSFALTDTGKVLGDVMSRQIGLGSNVTLDTITVPTEVILGRGSPGQAQTRCLKVVAGDFFFLFLCLCAF
jgi:alpha-tubulin suppressor-like RCC1 family protein